MENESREHPPDGDKCKGQLLLVLPEAANQRLRGLHADALLGARPVDVGGVCGQDHLCPGGSLLQMGLGDIGGGGLLLGSGLGGFGLGAEAELPLAGHGGGVGGG